MFFKRPRVAVVSIINTKDYCKMLKKIKGVFETVILTKMQYEKGVEPKTLKEECLKLGVKAVVEYNLIKDIRLAESLIAKKGAVVVFGLLF